MNNRGLSGIVVVVIVMLIAISAIALIWTYTRPVIENTSSRASFSIQELSTELTIKPESVIDASGFIEFDVEHSSGESEIVGVIVLLEDENKERFTSSEIPISLGLLETKPISLSHNLQGRIVAISIAPVFKRDRGLNAIGNIAETRILVGNSWVPSYSGGGGSSNSGNQNNPSCGNLNQICCTSGSVCSSGLSCVNNICSSVSGAVCGNNVLESGEECDDGNLDSCDGCDISCQNENSEIGGWSTFVPNSESRVIYVSSSLGNDAWSGLIPEPNNLANDGPKKTVSAGLNLLRSGKPDYLLLRRGDVWNEAIGNFAKSGKSKDERMVISYYWSIEKPRPVLKTGSSYGVLINSGVTNDEVRYVAFIGLDFYSSSRDPESSDFSTSISQMSPNGFHLGVKGNYITIEDCRFRFFASNTIQGATGTYVENVVVRRSVFSDDYSLNEDSHGLFLNRVDGLLVEENIFDHNGWNEELNVQPTIRSHNLYVNNDNKNIVFRDNIISRGSATGIQLRPGGILENNFFVRNPIAVLLGGGTLPNPQGVIVNVRDNVIIEGTDILSSPTQSRGFGFDVENIASGNIENNIVANILSASTPRGITYYPDAVHNAPTIGVFNLVVEDNIFYNWGGPEFNILLVNPNSNPNKFMGNVFRNNVIKRNVQGPLERSFTIPDILHIQPSAIVFSGNSFSSVSDPARVVRLGVPPQSYSISQVGLQVPQFSFSEPIVFNNPERGSDSYYQSICQNGDFDDLIDRAKEQTRYNWDSRFSAEALNDYIREGFGVA